MLVYVTGDMHGDIARFKSRELRKLKRHDFLIVCGDFGFLWDGSKKEKKLLDWIGKRRYHVLFVEGVHDNYDLLEQYQAEKWNGGEARKISGKLYQLCRGSIFQLDGLSVFAFGGGESLDADVRMKGKTWWEAELPTPEEIQGARENLTKADNQVDFIVTHQSSRKTKKFLTMRDDEANVLDVFFDEIRETCRYKRWFFGSYHIDKSVPPADIALFKAVVPMRADAVVRGGQRRKGKVSVKK